MSQNTTGAGWTADLAITPKKHKAFEDKLGSRTPVKFDHRINEVVRKVPPQTREIADSDSDFSDEADDDDDDLELPSLDAILGIKNDATKKPFVLRSGESSVEATPEKKLAGFMAIIRDTEEANELDRMQEAAAIELESSPLRDRSDKLKGRALFEEAVNIVQDEDDGDDSGREQHFAKVRQAMDRQAAGHTAPSYYFFAPVTGPSSAPATNVRMSPSPRPTTAREDNPRFNLSIQSKLATKYSGSPGIVLPDELLVWILEVFPAETSEAARAEYLQILTDRVPQVGRLIDEERLKRLFLSIGADKNAIDYGKHGKVLGQRDTSKTSRNWAPFYNLMELLRHCSGWMTVAPRIYTAVMLLRLSMDSEVRLQASVVTVVNDTLATLLSANCIEHERESFCRKVCSYFVQTVDSVNLLSRAVEATHHIGPQPMDIHQAAGAFKPFEDLRTRLQLSVFFKDADKASPGRCGTALLLIRSILQRLDDPDFKGIRAGGGGGGRSAINYYDLDGHGLALTAILPFLHHLRQQTTDSAELAEFSSGVDDLRRKVSLVNSTIHIVGSMEELEARHEAKNRWQRVDHWVSHFFPKKGGAGIFNDEMTMEEAEAEARAVERQARLMEKWAKKVPVANP